MTREQTNEALFRACESGDIEVVRILLDAGADPNARSSHSLTPFIEACANGHTAIVRLLLEAGADVNAKDERGEAPLHRPCERGYTDVVSLLVEANADVNARDKWCGFTPFIEACANGHSDIVRLLLEHGADVKTRTDDNDSALAHSCRSGRLECVAALITAGADANGDAVVPEPVTGNPSTPLEIAVRNSDPDNVEAREQIIDWYREHHPELVLETYCQGPGG